MDPVATTAISPLAATMLGIVIATISGLIVAAASVFWFGRLDRRQAELERKVDGDLERRLKTVETNADPERNGRINQQLATLVDLANRTAGEVSTIKERQAGIAATTENTREYIASVSKKAGQIGERLDDHLREHVHGK